MYGTYARIYARIPPPHAFVWNRFDFEYFGRLNIFEPISVRMDARMYATALIICTRIADVRTYVCDMRVYKPFIFDAFYFKNIRYVDLFEPKGGSKKRNW